MELHFLNQGRVDAILIGCDGEWAFIDAGYRKNGLASIRYMQKLGITKQRYYIATHGHKNHIGGAAPIIAQLHPEIVYVPRERVIDAIKKYAAGKEEKVAVDNAVYYVLKRGEAFPLGEATFSCVGPQKFKNVSCGMLSENYNSMILRGNYKGRTVLLTGDTSSGILEKIDDNEHGTIRAEIYKNAHHNGKTTQAVLRLIKPLAAVICNSGLPSAGYQKTFKKLGIKWYAACKRGGGNIIIKTNGKTWTVKKSKEE